MSKNPFDYFIGVDISKDKFNYCILNSSSQIVAQGEEKMNRNGFDHFHYLLRSFKNSAIALESTGPYHINLLSFLISNNHPTALINPSLIKTFSNSISLRKTKTDKIDSITIAKFILKNPEKFTPFVSSETDELLLLARTRESISQQVAKIKTQLKQHLSVTFPELLSEFNPFSSFFLSLLQTFPTPHHILSTPKNKIQAFFDSFYPKKGRKPSVSPENLISLAENSIGISSDSTSLIIQLDVSSLIFFQNQLNSITKTFIEKVSKTKKNEINILSSINGISDITSAHFIAEIKNIQRFENSKKLSAFAGLDPSFKQSGQFSSSGRISKRGSKSLRRVIFLMANGVLGYNPIYKKYYLKKRAQGMPHRKAMIALSNKLLRLIFALLSKNQKFNPLFHSL